ncbi:phosphotransferase [Maribacter aestuarii]|uniref:phosphotransferase n=1 Tax=Maribacter aestuarii TaxID=1130723 RepID=UPI0025A60533|nr:phosphotransferase [Maribacter aestuarii]
MIYFDALSPIPALEEYLLSEKWLRADERISKISTAGEGNMNVVLRIVTNLRSFILKQSRPFVQKYQQIAAPLERIAVEKRFYEAVQGADAKSRLPKILGYDAENYTLLLEDLGNCEDLSSIYASRNISEKLVEKLSTILMAIHKSTPRKSFPDNMEMRKLNHQHIFVLPFLVDNGFSLDDVQEGLQALSLPYKKDTALKKIISEIGNIYLENGTTLLHGDYYPGSWMTEKDNLYIIDPEFAFVGFPEFDLGVMAGHLIMATDNQNTIGLMLHHYVNAVDESLVAKMAGIEIMRRIIGLAQLPMQRTLEEKENLMKLAYKMIKQ